MRAQRGVGGDVFVYVIMRSKLREQPLKGHPRVRAYAPRLCEKKRQKKKKKKVQRHLHFFVLA